MRVKIIFHTCNFLGDVLETFIDWPCPVLPRTGEEFAEDLLEELIDWYTFDKEEVADKILPEFQDWVQWYEKEFRNSHSHVKAMKEMLGTFLCFMRFVESIMWTSDSKGIYPIIWVSNETPLDSLHRKIDNL